VTAVTTSRRPVTTGRHDGSCARGFSACNGWPHLRRSTTGSCQSTATSEIVKRAVPVLYKNPTFTVSTTRSAPVLVLQCNSGLFVRQVWVRRSSSRSTTVTGTTTVSSATSVRRRWSGAASSCLGRTSCARTADARSSAGVRRAATDLRDAAPDDVILLYSLLRDAPPAASCRRAFAAAETRTQNTELRSDVGVFTEPAANVRVPCQQLLRIGLRFPPALGSLATCTPLVCRLNENSCAGEMYLFQNRQAK